MDFDEYGTKRDELIAKMVEHSVNRTDATDTIQEIINTLGFFGVPRGTYVIDKEITIPVGMFINDKDLINDN